MEKHISQLIKKLSTPEKIQNYLYQLKYNPDSSARSAHQVLLTQTGHCFEGALVSAFLLEAHGHQPLLMDLRAHHDDDHVVALFQYKKRWGALSKTNTAVLGYRPPVHKTLRELALSYFPLYINVKGYFTLYEFAAPINLRSKYFKKWDWRFGTKDLQNMGISFNKLPHERIIEKKDLIKLPKAHPHVLKAAFVGAKRSALYQP